MGVGPVRHDAGVDGTDVLRAADLAADHLSALPDADWSRPVPDSDRTVAELVAHVAECLLWYTLDLSAGPRELTGVTVAVGSASPPAELVAALRTFAVTAARTVDGVPEGWRGWHPAGLADASGFAGMACDEILVHTWDVAAATGRDFTPPADLAARTLARLFPWAPADAEPWPGLLWANGRVDLPGRDRQRNWTWHCAPLSEWTGTRPA